MGYFKNKKIILVLELLFFATLALIIGSAQTLSPFYGDLNLIDEGQFAAWANQMLHGKLMFKDLYITYGPLYVYPLYILFKLFSPSAFLVRLYITFGSVLGIVVLNFLMLNMGISRFGRYFMNLLLILLPLIILRQAVLFIAVYYLFLTDSNKNSAYFFITGIFLTLTFLISPELGIILMFIGGLFYLFRLFVSVDKVEFVKKIFYSALGLIISFTAFLFWANSEGWLYYYFNTTLQLFINFSSINVPNGQALPNVFTNIPDNLNVLSWIKFFLLKDLFIYYILAINIFLLTFIFIKTILRKTTENDFKIVLLLLIGFAFFYLFVGRPDFPHLFFGLSPIFLILIYYLDKNLNIYKKLQKYNFSTNLKLLIAFIIFLFIARIVYINNPQIKNIVKILPTITTAKTNPPLIGPILISAKQTKYFSSLNNFIEKNTNSNEKIFILSDEPMLYLILNRDNATKYNLPFIANLKNMREELVLELMQNKPKFILYNKSTWAVDGINNVIRLPEVVAYINLNYSKLTVVEGVTIYKLKTPQYANIDSGL